MFLRSKNVLWTLALCVSARAQTVAPDPTGNGPFSVAFGDYSLPAAVDSMVLPGCIPHPADPSNYVLQYDCKTQVKGRVYYPGALSGKYPVIVMLHGNHATCGHMYNPATDTVPMIGTPRIDDDVTFTGSGVCSNPKSSLEAPSYLGYSYLASKLASWGYIVVSVDANRGLGGVSAPEGVAGDTNLIRARGALLLRNLQTLSNWDLNGNTPAGVGVELQGHLDFSNLGMMGHSRGGEGVRAAYNLYRDNTNGWRTQISEPLRISAIYEIAPTDGPALYDNRGVTWGVLLAMCDGDVAHLDGMKPLDRAVMDHSESPALQKSATTVWGANHNFFNTQWQVSDATFDDGTPFCTGPGNDAVFAISPGSNAQQIAAATAVLAFFRGNLGPSADLSFNRVFNPPFGIPNHLANGVNPTDYPVRSDRVYRAPGERKVVEDFSKPTGTSAYGVPNTASNVQVMHTAISEHDSALTTALVIWSSPGPGTYFQTNWTAGNASVDVRRFRTLDIRVSRMDDPSVPMVDFSIQLVRYNGQMTRPVLASAYADPNFAGAQPRQSVLTPPPGALNYDDDPYIHEVMQTIRIPLTAFGNFAEVGAQMKGVRLTFDHTPSAVIFVSDIEVSAAVDAAGSTFPPIALASTAQPTAHSVTAALSPEARALPASVPVYRNQSVTKVHTAAIAAIRHATALPELHGSAGYRIEIQNPEGFPIRDAAEVLVIGDRTYTASSGALGNHRAVFSLSDAEFASLPPGRPVRLQYGNSKREYWDCGLLDLSAITYAP